MPVDVLIVLGSKTDAEVGKQASSFLDQFGVGYDMVVASAHRTPDLLRDLIRDRKSTRLNSSHSQISYAVFCLKKKKNNTTTTHYTTVITCFSSTFLVLHFCS